MKIGIFDSGIGGMNVLNRIKELLPKEDYIYYADNLNNPYGDKDITELNKITEDIINYLVRANCKVVVIACNTATTRCMSYLRSKFPNLIIIGTVPAIKAACDENYHNILVLGTPNTVKSERVKELIDENKKDEQIVKLLGCEGLAEAIENRELAKVRSILIHDLGKIGPVDCVVLGCTHYNYVITEIKEILGNVVIIDGDKGVAKEVEHQLSLHNLLENNHGEITYIETK